MLLWDASVSYIQDKEEWGGIFRALVGGGAKVGGWKRTIGGKNCSVSGISCGSAQVHAGSHILVIHLKAHTSIMLLPSSPTPPPFC